MFKSLDSIASVVEIFMYLTISTFNQVLRSRKGLDYNTGAIWLTGWIGVLEYLSIIQVFIKLLFMLSVAITKHLFIYLF